MQEMVSPTTAFPAEAPSSWIDLERYPILDLDSAPARALIATARESQRRMGACELPGFVLPEAVARLTDEAVQLSPIAFRSTGYGTAYTEIPDFSLPEDHPRRRIGPYATGVIAYDQIPPSAALRRLYEWDPMMRFIEAVLDRGTLYRYADPMGALNVAVMNAGDELQWHFDQTDFVVSLALRSAQAGGDFEVAPLIRSADSENYDAVDQVFNGSRKGVTCLPMCPGTLLIFEGRYSLHRVTPIEGDVARYVALLAYDTKPGTISSEILRLGRYGRTS
jgi:hypothetical protein